MISDTDVHQIATQVRNALTNLGMAYQTKDGATVEISYRRLARAGDRYILLEVDTNRLPPKVSIPRLDAPDVLTHLGAVVHHPVKRLNSVGLTYAVEMQPRPKPKPFAAKVPLPATTPAGLHYAWPVGVDRAGTPYWVDLDTAGHLLIAGKTGAGKSVGINSGLVALLRSHGPDTLQLALIDPKVVELAGYTGLPHLVRPVATEPAAAAEMLQWLLTEMERRKALLVAASVKNLADYNRANRLAPMPRLLIVVDEVADLTLQWGGTKTEPFRDLVRLCAQGRAFGFTLLLATQNPRSDVLDSLARDNASVKIAYKVDHDYQSRSILGVSGAEQLPPHRPGRCYTVGVADGPMLLQGFFVGDAEVQATIAGLVPVNLSPLSDDERMLVDFSAQTLGGAFKLQALYEAHRGVWSLRRLKALGQAWEAKGWLTHPVDAVSPRLITDELRLLAGLGVGSSGDTAIPGAQGT